MKAAIALFLLIGVAAVLLLGGAGPASAQIATATPSGPVVTPTPAGEITVPAFTIQIFAPGANPLINQPDSSNRVAGPLLGIWHGIISPITLIVSFVNPAVQMYEVHNDGSPYNLGYLIGVALVFLLLGILGGSRRRR